MSAPVPNWRLGEEAVIEVEPRKPGKVLEEKENTDWKVMMMMVMMMMMMMKVYLTTLLLLGGVAIILVVKFLVTNFSQGQDQVNQIKT